MKDDREYRSISIDGLEIIGRGAHGIVYKIDDETIVKVYRPDISLERICAEKERARKAFVLGVPTAISYDIVKVGSNYGTVYELLNAEPTEKFINKSIENRERFVEMSVALLKEIHAIEADPSELADMKADHLRWIENVSGIIGGDMAEQIKQIVLEVPDSRKLLHGDFHMKNIIICRGEPMLIDMDTLCLGDGLFDLATMCNSYWTFPHIDPQAVTQFLGISVEDSEYIWKKSLKLYLNDKNKDELEAVNARCCILGLLRILDYANRGGDNAHKDIMIEKGLEILHKQCQKWY
ncbi:MAG: phosphotransferase [Lachnospiraceae bacterium]|nr:phosphotransferase [Lachnospiraceae bacterium]